METASQLLRYVGGTLVVTQTVLVRQYWEEIQEGLEQAGVPVRHFVLHSDPGTRAERIGNDAPETRGWRLKHLDEYREALTWLREEASIVDTTHLRPGEVARTVAEQAGVRTRPPHTSG